jgi:hypothetical protein
MEVSGQLYTPATLPAGKRGNLKLMLILIRLKDLIYQAG